MTVRLKNKLFPTSSYLNSTLDDYNPDEESDGNTVGDLEDEDTESDTTNVESALKVVKSTKKTDKLKKKLVMPTWAATQHLLGKQRGETQDSVTNCEAIAPLFRNPPKDLATLWTVLSHT